MTHEIDESEDYVHKVAKRLSEKGIDVEAVVAPGEPAEEIIRQAKTRNVDLIAMSTHGHKGIYDLILGSVADAVRHDVSIPVLLIRGYS
jgi:manganese transport protein